MEGIADGFSVIGSDIDPVAVFIARAKTRRHSFPALVNSCSLLCDQLRNCQRSDTEYDRRKFEDITSPTLQRIVRQEGLPVPPIPHLAHWFRNYVSVDLGRIRKVILFLPVPETHREFMLLCFGSMIRGASNADPVPVSGLEVTAHMRRVDARGRVINPFALLQRAIERNLMAALEFGALARQDTTVRVIQADATELCGSLNTKVDTVITSPPYHNAVDYHRRHQLEMYWLGLTATPSDRLALLPKYIGRPGGAHKRHPFVRDSQIETPLAARWESRIRRVAPPRADNFKHYVVAMTRVFAQLAELVTPGGRVVFVVGHSTWNGTRIPTAFLLQELARKAFRLREQSWYPLPNRYMSYSRHNGASIHREYVVAFERR